MNTHVKNFLLRGMIFGGFGPIVMAGIYLALSLSISGFSLSGDEVFFAVLSTYLLAFLQAGASVFREIERIPFAVSNLMHFGLLYIAYTACYLVNAWIPFDGRVVLIFTGIFAVGYLVVWLSVYFSIRLVSNRFNERLSERAGI